MTWHIDLDERTATSINGITFKMTKAESGEYSGVFLNPERGQILP